MSMCQFRKSVGHRQVLVTFNQIHFLNVLAMTTCKRHAHIVSVPVHYREILNDIP